MSQFSFDATLENFQTDVAKRCMTVPVVLDFWAPWCAPCKTLKPLLEKLAEEFKGRFFLAKINSDDNPQLAQHFGVRSIPAVKVLYQGQLVDEFTGVLPESDVRAFLNRIALPADEENPQEAASRLRGENRLEEALAVLFAASEKMPDDEALRLDAIELLLQLNRLEEAKNLLALDYKSPRATGLRSRLALLSNTADTRPLEEKLSKNPDDHESRLQLSKALASQNQFREALDTAMEVLRRDRHFNNGEARQTLLQFFDALAGDIHDDLVREYRRKMSALLN